LVGKGKLETNYYLKEGARERRNGCSIILFSAIGTVKVREQWRAEEKALVSVWGIQGPGPWGVRERKEGGEHPPFHS